jgi:quinol monooxygenase YgiN
MYASVTTGQVKPGHMDEYLNAFQTYVTPMVRAFSGLKDLYVLVDRAANEAMTIGIYDSQASADRTQQSGDYQQGLSKIADHLVLSTLQRRGYEVGVSI